MRRIRRLAWWDSLPDHLRGRLICSWRGHAWKLKMYDRVCRRCSISGPL